MKRSGKYGHPVDDETGHKIIFIWEYEIRDEFFWIGDYLDVGEVM